MPFEFLRLPAELRNWIYELCAKSDKRIAISRDKNRNDGNYAALTRVSREVRSEYKKIQRREARVKVYWDDLQEWLTVFVDGSETPKEICIIVTEQEEQFYEEVDIIKLLRLIHSPQSETICSVILNDYFGTARSRVSYLPDLAITENLNRLLTRHNSVRFLKFLNGGVDLSAISVNLWSRSIVCHLVHDFSHGPTREFFRKADTTHLFRHWMSGGDVLGTLTWKTSGGIVLEHSNGKLVEAGRRATRKKVAKRSKRS